MTLESNKREILHAICRTQLSAALKIGAELQRVGGNPAGVRQKTLDIITDTLVEDIESLLDK